MEKSNTPVHHMSDEERTYLETMVRLVDFAHEKRVDVLVAPEASGRAQALLFREIFERRYPGENAPNAFFVNFRNVRTPEEVREHFPGLANELRKGTRAMIIDSCVHSGETMERASTALMPFAKERVLKAAVSVGSQARCEARGLGKLDFAGPVQDVCHFFTADEVGFRRSAYSNKPRGDPTGVSQAGLKETRENIKKLSRHIGPRK